jgi:aspartyl-tRNA(Asn)/glutamyl-tRNA(Gln) amidotransferase subunit C
LYPLCGDKNYVTLSIKHVIEQAIKYCGHDNIKFKNIFSGEMAMLSAEEVKKIAHLARLGIEEQNVDAYASDLNGILTLMTQMAELDTTHVKPMAHPMDQVQRLRVDEVTEVNQRDYFQINAPKTEDGLYLVPKVID